MEDHEPAADLPSPPQAHDRSRRLRVPAGVAAAAAVVLIGVGGGVGYALADRGSPPTPASSGAVAAPASPATSRPGDQPGSGTLSGATATKAARVDPARRGWAETYGSDRATMPVLPDVGSASTDQQAAAQDLLSRTRAAIAPYADPAVAKAAGFDIQAALARVAGKRPGLAPLMQRIDAGAPVPPDRMPMLHVPNTSGNRTDGRVLDPSAPETVMFEYQGGGRWMPVGVMFTANEAYPQAPPTPGGPITRWHYHSKGGQPSGNLMMHVFVTGDDLAKAYATTMDG